MTETNDCTLFSQYAGNRLSVWKMLEGQVVIHTTFGLGIITNIDIKENSAAFYIWICFENDSEPKRQFTTDSLCKSKFFSNVTLPASLSDISSVNHRLSTQERAYSSKMNGQPQTETRIQQICAQRKITALCHFTHYENLSSILENGLCGRDALETWPLERQPRFNDTERLDGHKEAICLSISFPNYKMFYKYSRENRAEWVILLLKPSILWELRCAYFDDNAASARAREAPFVEKFRLHAFEGLFSDCEDVSRKDLQIPDSYPTNPQAEVLVFQSIHPKYIKKVHFYCKKSLDQWLSGNNEIDLRILCANQRYFQPREDWDAWGNS